MNFPIPDNDEIKVLKRVIEDWDSRSPIQAALALAVLRGHTNYQSVSEYLRVPISELVKANRTLWGILCDGNTGTLWIK